MGYSSQTTSSCTLFNFTFLTAILTTLVVHTTLHPFFTQAAFTQPVTYDSSSIRLNSAGTWCFYPRGGYRTKRACTGDTDGEFAPLIKNHLQHNISIGYYSKKLERLGGAEFVLDGTGADGSGSGSGDGGDDVYLCLSGKSEDDGKYVTECQIAMFDDVLGMWGGCAIEDSQRGVSDGCYEADKSPVSTTNMLNADGAGSAGNVTLKPGGMTGGSELKHTGTQILGVSVLALVSLVVIL